MNVGWPLEGVIGARAPIDGTAFGGGEADVTGFGLPAGDCGGLLTTGNAGGVGLVLEIAGPCVGPSDDHSSSPGGVEVTLTTGLGIGAMPADGV